MNPQKLLPVVRLVQTKSTPRLLYPNVAGHTAPSQAQIWVQSLSETTASFCRETTLHGIRNIADAVQQLISRNATRQQKFYNIVSLVLWCGAFCLGTVFAVILMRLIWERFRRTPTITTVETNNYPIWNVDFPAVTICNNNKVYAPAAQRIADMLPFSTNTDFDRPTIIDYFGQLAKLVAAEYVSRSDEAMMIHQHLVSLNYTTERLMFELMQPCDEMLVNCTWLGKATPCKQMFRVAKSSEGFCCSFNYKAPLDFLEVDSDNKYIDDQLDDPIYRVSGNGPYVGLDALIRVEPASYTAYTKSYFGAAIMIHGSRVYPQAGDKTTFGQPGCDVTVAVIPSVVVSQPPIRALALSDRNCFFDDERRLRTTTKYTFQSCISECAVDTILQVCNCLPFYYMEVRLKPFFDGRRQCTLNDSACLRDNRHIFYSLQPDDVNQTLGMYCDRCMPSCTEENYEVQTVISRRSDSKSNLSSVLYANIDLSKSVTLKVHFKDISCIKYRRDVFMTWDGLLASFGGIFGLCLGGSILSLVEFVYYFTFKLYGTLQQRRQHLRLTSRRHQELKQQRTSRIAHLLLRRHRNGVKWGTKAAGDGSGGGAKSAVRGRVLEISVVSSAATTLMDKQFVAMNSEKLFRARSGRIVGGGDDSRVVNRREV